MTGGSGVALSAETPMPVNVHGKVGVSLHIDFKNPDGEVYATYHNDEDMTLLQYAIMGITGLMGVGATSIQETGGTSQNTNGAMTANTPVIEFGTNSTAATWSDHAIGTAAAATNPVTGTVSAITANSTNGTFTVTGTWTNSGGGSVTITEVAMYVTSTAGVASNKTYAITHDVFTGVAVSVGGTAAATLTYTYS